MDYPGRVLSVIDFFFSGLFVCELILKLALVGFRGQFCRSGAASNIFDASLIFIDVTQSRWTLGVTSSAEIQIEPNTLCKLGKHMKKWHNRGAVGCYKQPDVRARDVNQ